MQRPLGEPHVVLIGVGEAEDPGATVTRSALVPELELLQEDDPPTCLRERSRRRDSHDSCSDDDDLGVDRSRGALARYGAIPRAAFDAARESAW